MLRVFVKQEGEQEGGHCGWSCVKECQVRSGRAYGRGRAWRRCRTASQTHSGREQFFPFLIHLRLILFISMFGFYSNVRSVIKVCQYLLSLYFVVDHMLSRLV